MNPVKTIKYYLNDDRTWSLEIDEGEIWLRNNKGFQLMDLDLLKMLHIAAGELIKEIKEEKNCE